ncbi:MAG: PaaI family thioesterase [Deltaproteobacteria bacterium]|nr:PaaI family thioesterase [Deltaproteobacteria bacterium]
MNDGKIAFQDVYPDWAAHCYGCGRLNEHGLKLKTYRDGVESVTRFTPLSHHTAIPGYVYGGLIASVIDCHSTGTAAAAAYRAEGRELGTAPELRFVTASLHVDYLRPTPIDAELVVRGKVEEVKGRKIVVSSELFAKGELCARGRVVAVRAPENLILGR